MATLKELLQRRLVGLGTFESQANLPMMSSVLLSAVDALPAGPNLTGPRPSTFSLDGETVVVIPRKVPRINHAEENSPTAR